MSKKGYRSRLARNIIGPKSWECYYKTLNNYEVMKDQGELISYISKTLLRKDNKWNIN